MDPVTLAVGSCCGLSGVGLVVGWLLRVKLVRVLQALAASANSTPARVHLEPAPEQTTPPKAFVDAAAALQAHGFRSVGRFELVELGRILVEGFAGPDGDSLAAAYNHPLAGTWVDIMESSLEGPDDEDARGIDRTISSGREPRGLLQPEWKQTLHLEGADLPTLIEAFDADRLPPPRRLFRSDEFVAEFESAWAEEQDWRNARGGPSREEIAAVGGSKASPQVVEESWRLQHSAAIAGLRVAFLEQLQPLPEDAGEGEFLFVHDVMDEDDLAELLEDSLGLGDVQIPDLPARQAFPVAIQALPEQFRPFLFTQLEQPVSCDVYRLALSDGRSSDGQ